MIQSRVGTFHVWLDRVGAGSRYRVFQRIHYGTRMRCPKTLLLTIGIGLAAVSLWEMRRLSVFGSGSELSARYGICENIWLDNVLLSYIIPSV